MNTRSRQASYREVSLATSVSIMHYLVKKSIFKGHSLKGVRQSRTPFLFPVYLFHHEEHTRNYF